MASYNDWWALEVERRVRQLIEEPKESVSLDVKRAFPYGIYGRR
jgi:hypothetical protein